MATIIGDLMCPTGKYTTQDGQEKVRWLKCGVVLETDKGMRVKIEAMPVGVPDFEGWFSVFAKEPKEPEQPQGFRRAPEEQATQDDIPF